MKHIIGRQLEGNYTPSDLNWVIFCITVISLTLLFSFGIGNSVKGALKAFPFVLLTVSVVASEINLRHVVINEDYIASSGPLKLYQQKIATEEIDGIRRVSDHPVEVLHNGRAIVFASNRRFKSRVSALMSELDDEYTY